MAKCDYPGCTAQAYLTNGKDNYCTPHADWAARVNYEARRREHLLPESLRGENEYLKARVAALEALCSNTTEDVAPIQQATEPQVTCPVCGDATSHVPNGMWCRGK